MDVQMTEECKVVLLNLTSRYAQTWSHWEGIREFIQNWHDGIYDASDKHIRRHYTGFGESQKVNFIKRRDDTEEVVYEAMVAINGGTENYGSLHYDKFNKRLTLINRGISLQKKILLLGFSSHSHTRNENVIGQFGEGLKIGALALVRQGRYVTMETNKERWQFAMHPYEHYGGEQGLVVLVTKSERIHFEDKEELDFIFPPCPVELQEEDTSCSISSISSEEFEECRQRFLFLTPPTEQVKTEIGTLLLDDIFGGKLFVKGSFVVDLKDNGLITGVNFFDLKIDRDRNAVPQLSEIDHKVSCMWPRALVSRRDLATRYYDLLVNHAECRDVKHAKTYANTDESVAPKLMVEEFRKRTAENSFPILDSFQPHQAASIQQELGQPIVQVNEILLSILLKSGQYITLDEARERLRPDKSTLRPTSSLTEDQNSVLRQAIIMVNQVDPHLRTNMIVVIDTKTEEKPAIRDDKIEIPVWMVKPDVVHKYGKLCKSTKSECCCRQVRLCNAFLALRKEHIQDQPGRHAKEFPPDQTLMCALAKFSSKKNEKQKPYCVDLHQSGNVLDNDQVHAGCVNEEERLRRVIKNIKLDLVDSQKAHQDELAKLSHECTLVRKDLMNSMVRDADVDAQIEDLEHVYSIQLMSYKDSEKDKMDNADERITELREQIMELDKELKHKQSMLAEQKKHVEQLAKSMDHKHHAMVEKVTFYRRTLQEKSEQVRNKDAKFAQNLCRQVAKTCQEICKELEGQSYMCMLCRSQKRSHIVFPCNHYKFCESCVNQIHGRRCPAPGCKRTVESVKKMFE